ncbi:hypothetical protein V2I01_42940 [Micromonospora sp. BRA006-A]|nr:hypothetical protein [Micromonospora sp. BRA006-A]
MTLRHGGDPVTLDLTADAPIRELCRSLCPAPPDHPADATVEVSADLAGVTVSGLPAAYADDLRADLADVLSTLDPDDPSAGCCRRPATSGVRRRTCGGCTAATAPRPAGYAATPSRPRSPRRCGRTRNGRRCSPTTRR